MAKTKYNYKLKQGKKIDHREVLSMLFDSKHKEGLFSYLRAQTEEMITSNPQQVPGFIALELPDGANADKNYCGVAAVQINNSFKESKSDFRIRYIPGKKGFALVTKAQYESVFG